MTKSTKTNTKEKDYVFKEEELRRVYDIWKSNPSPQNLQAVIDAARPIMTYAARYYVSDLADSPVLALRAKRLVAEAIPKYEPSRGPLSNYLMLVLQRLQRYGGQERQMIKLSERVAMDSKMLSDAASEFFSIHGREPTTEELADLTGLSMRRISRIRKMAALTVPESRVSAPMSEEESTRMVVGKIIGEEGKEFNDLVQTYYMTADPANKLILEKGLGLFGQPKTSLSDIAKELNMSPAAVTQRLNKMYAELSEMQSLLRS